MSAIEIIYAVSFVISLIVALLQRNVINNQKRILDLYKERNVFLNEQYASLLKKADAVETLLFDEKTKAIDASARQYNERVIKKISTRMEFNKEDEDYRGFTPMRFAMEENIKQMKDSLFEEACKHVEIESNNLLQRNSFANREIIVSMYIGVDKYKENEK